jgi:hypothetical protein
MKPVAWRYENKNVKGIWYIIWTEPPDGFNKRPLYEHQPEDEAAWRELDDERVAYINRVGDILGQVGEDSLEDTATRVIQQLASRDVEVAKLRDEVIRCRDWFETQVKVKSKGGPSSWELMLLRDERDAAEEALAATAPKEKGK